MRKNVTLAQPVFLSKPMEEMTQAEWESLCDGCGLCCQIRVQEEGSEVTQISNVACKYLCLNSHHCTDYANRQANVPDCVAITPQNVRGLEWLPKSCAYRVVARGEALAPWHYLMCGDRERVHNHGPSMRGNVISEEDADWG